MKILYYNDKRQSGKTTKLIELFNQDPENSILIVLRNKEVFYKFIDTKYHKRIITQESHPCGYRTKFLLIDEYDFIQNKGKFTKKFLPILEPDSTIVIRTTPKKSYRKHNLVIAKLLNKYNLPLTDYQFLDERDVDEINQLRESFISFPETSLFDTSISDNEYYYNKTEQTGEMFV